MLGRSEPRRDETRRDETKREQCSGEEQQEQARGREGVRTGEPTDLDTIFRHSYRFSVHTQLGLAKKKMTVPFPTLGHYFLQDILQHRYFAYNMCVSLFHLLADCPVLRGPSPSCAGWRQQQQHQLNSKRNEMCYIEGQQMV